MLNSVSSSLSAYLSAIGTVYVKKFCVNLVGAACVLGPSYVVVNNH